MSQRIQLRQEAHKPKVSRYYKAIFVSVLATVLLIWRFLREDKDSPICIDDKMHYATEPINKAMREAKFWRTFLIGIGQFIIDSWFLLLLSLWTIFTRNIRFPVSVGIFYLIRSQFLNILKFPFPPGIQWHNPGFFSLSVPYDHTRDFFYSGHTGILCVVFSQLWALGWKTMALICSGCISFIIMLLLSTRVHYSADIFCGLVIGFYIHFMVSKHLYYIDLVMCFPFRGLLKLYYWVYKRIIS